MTYIPIAEWLDAQLESGRDDLLEIMEASPYPRAAVRTIAEDGTFAIENGKRVVRADGFSWFLKDSPIENRGNGEFAWDVLVDDPSQPIEAPLALVSVLGVPRLDRVVLMAEPGAQIVSYIHEPKVAPLSAMVDGKPGHYTLVFNPAEKTMRVEEA